MQKTGNIPFLLLFVILFASVAAPSILQLKIILIKWEAAERLEKNHLQVLHIPVKNIIWAKTGKEIIINHRLFDVEKYSQNENEIVVTGMFDDEETALEKQVDELWQQEKPKHNLILVKYFQVLAQCYLPKEVFHLNETTSPQKNYPPEISFYHEKIFLEIPCPPPQKNTFFIIS